MGFVIKVVITILSQLIFKGLEAQVRKSSNSLGNADVDEVKKSMDMAMKKMKK